jgi:hypothetical protein
MSEKLERAQGPDFDAISSLFSQWAANLNAHVGADYSGMSEAEKDASFEEYASLQRRIIAAVPTTPEEVAQQLIAATDDGASIMPDELFERFRQMARGTASKEGGPE